MLSQMELSSGFNIPVSLYPPNDSKLWNYDVPNNVSDPYGIHLIRSQGFGDQKLKTISAKKKLNIFLIKNCNLPDH